MSDRPTCALCDGPFSDVEWQERHAAPDGLGEIHERCCLTCAEPTPEPTPEAPT